MQKPARIHIPPRAALSMVWAYLKSRLLEQVKAVAFIILYLVGFQILVLGTTPANATRISAGIALFIFGLTFFLEGLLLGLMPLGERVGVQLPKRTGLIMIVLFGLLLGVGSTLAEPAIAALRAAGRAVTPWEAPLLFRLLETEPERLVTSIGAGVGIAVAFGMLRFYYGLSIRWFIYSVVPLLLGATLFCSRDPKLVQILGLAWDAGAVTTGAVTVPLVLALGIGVSRAVGRQAGAGAGFGMVMLASAFPVLGVLVLGGLLHASTPAPVNEGAFFNPANREAALQLVGSEKQLMRLAFQRGSETGRRSFFSNELIYLEALDSLAYASIRHERLGDLTLDTWLSERAAPAERVRLRQKVQTNDLNETTPIRIAEVLRKESIMALRAVVPLAALLLGVLLLILRDIPRRSDEVLLGIGFALIGMSLLTSGIRLGLAPLGDQVGRPLPRVFRSMAREEGRILLQPFDAARVQTAYAVDGTVRRFFYLENRAGHPQAVSFDPEQFDPAAQRYEHIIKRPPLFSPKLTLAGIGLVFLFAFGLGYGSTLAEPALSALGRTVEELTVGTIRRRGVVRAVSVGVGIGLVAGVARILYDLPMVWMIVPPYLLLFPLTHWSQEDFAAIAWDCGGVTTGIVTVPLVLAMGLGIGGELNVVDGFGVLAMASVYPVITVLFYGLTVRLRQHRNFKTTAAEEPHE